MRGLSVLSGSMLLWVALAAHGQAAQFEIRFNDPPGVGFNDPRVITQAQQGGLPGETFGAARRRVVLAAAAYWQARLVSPVPITVGATFQSAPCGNLGSAGPTTLIEVPVANGMPNTFYPVALANALTGFDNQPGGDDIRMNFNANVDGGCPGFDVWRYSEGFNAPNGTTSLFSTVLHELAHGLGFVALVDADGTYFQNTPAIFDRFLFDESRSQLLTQLPAAQRAQSLINSDDADSNNSNLTWAGPGVQAQAGQLASGRHPNPPNRIQMFAPRPFDEGSSVSHWTIGLQPDALMEPVATPGEPLLLAGCLLRDLGWQVTALGCPGGGTTSPTMTPSPPPSVTATPAPPPDSSTLLLVDDLAGLSGSRQFFNFSVPAGASRLTVTLTGGVGDADLYVRFGAPPTLDDDDCQSVNVDSNELCVLDNPPAGEWFVEVFGFENFAGVRVEARIVPGATVNPTPTPSPTVTPSPLPTVSPTPTPGTLPPSDPLPPQGAGRFFMLRGDGPAVIGGTQDDSYIVSETVFADGGDVQLSDVNGAERIHLIDSTTIAAALFAADSMRLTLPNGRSITVLGASRFQYLVGSDPLSGVPGSALGYARLVQEVFGLDEVPTGNRIVAAAAPVTLNFAGTRPTPFVPQPPNQPPPTQGRGQTLVATRNGAGVIGGGGGDDRYIVAPGTAVTGADVRVTDTVGSDRVQLVSETRLEEALFAVNTAQFRLLNGGVVTVLDAARFIYEVGGNPLFPGERGRLVTYGELVEAVFGLALPTGSGVARIGNVGIIEDRVAPLPPP